MNTMETYQNELQPVQRASLVIGVIGLGLCVAGLLRDPIQLWRSYLFAIVFWIGVAVACTALLMLQYLIGGKWAVPLRRYLESGSFNVIWMVILALPIFFVLPKLYLWADPQMVASDPLLQYKSPYLNIPFFTVRTLIYFGIWLIPAVLLNRYSVQQDEGSDPQLVAKMKRLSAPFLLLHCLAVTFFAVDWVMSLEPHWFSTIYGLIFLITQALAAMSVVTISVIMYSDRKPFDELVSDQTLNDYGNLLLTFTMLWAYLSFSQFLIIWAGNLQEEIPWYVSRAQRGWAFVALLLVILHFAVPFLLLLSRTVKRNTRTLGAVAAGLVVLSVVDLFWLLTPAFDKVGPAFHWTDWAALLGIGGIWFWRYTAQLQGKTLIPVNDPRLKGVVQHG